MAKKKTEKSESKKQQQTAMQGEAFKRPNRIPEIDKAAEEFRKARDARMAKTKIESEKKSILKGLIKKHGLTDPYFYDDDDGDTEEVKPIVPDPEDVDVKVNKVRQAKAKSDE